MKSLFSNRLTRLVCILIAFFGIYWGFQLWKGRNDGFAVEKITPCLTDDPKWVIPQTQAMVAQVNQLVKQPFEYLGHGFQFYAFTSSDGQYVLKFLRHQRLRPSPMYRMLPDWPLIRRLKEKKSRSRQKRIEHLFTAMKIGFEDIPEQTGLIAVHLNKTNNLYPKVTLIDLLEDPHTVALDDTEFVLQHKATLIKPTLKGLMQAGQVKDAKKRINQILELFVECAQKGVVDTDTSLIKNDNLGFLKDRAIYIDIGKLARRKNIDQKRRFQHNLRRLRPLQRWLVAHYPPLGAHYDKEQKRILASLPSRQDTHKKPTEISEATGS